MSGVSNSNGFRPMPPLNGKAPLQRIERQAISQPYSQPVSTADRWVEPTHRRDSYSVAGATDDLMARHDRNRDGYINYRQPTRIGPFVDNESTYEVSSTVRTSRYGSASRTSTVTRYPLFEEADGNSDGRLTAGELDLYISRKFDKNQNGWLEHRNSVLESRREWDRFAEAVYGR